MFSDNEMINRREEYCEKHSFLPNESLLEALQKDTQEHFSRPQMLSGPLQGSFLAFISGLIRPRRILEVGTYTAYSTICLAHGLEKGGELITLEKDGQLQERIEKSILEAGLQDRVQVLWGDALEHMDGIEPTFDLVFIDAAKRAYRDYTERALDLLSDRGLIIIDNVLFHNEVLETPPVGKIAGSIHDFNQWLSQLKGVERVMLPVRDGLTLLRKTTR
ncbi:MAG TPA: O-methyltransferase [Saprospiraceae bacterium]|nr:O-methyltransferase [Saprospiraceae bacterium]